MLETNMARWEREWQERSKAAGEIEGRRASILHILERRFGTIDETVRNRLAEATLDDLDIYLDRVVDSPDVDSIFAS